MAYVETTIAVDPATGLETDLSAVVDRQKSTYHPVAHGKSKQSTQFLSFRADAPVGAVHEGWPWMHGWRDPTTRFWDGSRAVYCGQIGRQTGRAGNIRHYIDQTLDGWESTFTDTALLHWPNGDFVSVYPVGYSVKNWLVGTAPFAGLVRTVYDAGKVDFDGVDAAFDRLIIDATSLPAIGKSVVHGAGQFCYLQDGLDTMVAVAQFLSPGMDPVAFMQPIIAPGDPTQIVPRFRFVDRNAVGDTPVARYSTAPVGDEWPIEQPFSHDRDLRPAKSRIIVVGKGGDKTLPGSPLVMVDYSVGAHLAAYPTWVHATPGRALVLVDERINTIAVCTAIAQAIEAKIYGPEGRLTFRTSRPTQPGELIEITIPQEGQDHARFVVVDAAAVAGQVGRPLYDVTVGAPAPDFRSLIDRAVNSAANDIPLATARALHAGLGAQNTPKYRQPLDANPHTTAQNTTTPRDTTVVGQTIQGTATPPPGDDPSTVTPANLWEAWAAGAAAPGTAISPDGRPHPQVYPLAFTAAGTSDPMLLHWDADFTTIRLKGTGSVVLNKNGVAATGTITGTGVHTFAAVHYSEAANDDFSVTASGVSGTLSVVVSE